MLRRRRRRRRDVMTFQDGCRRRHRRRDVTANWNIICRVPASAQNVTCERGFSNRPETVPVDSVDAPELIGTTSTRIRPIPDFGEIQ